MPHVAARCSEMFESEPLSGSAARSQRSWDAAAINHGKTALVVHNMNPIDRARLLAVSAPHAGDWLMALPVASCGLRLDNESIRVAVGLRLGCVLCSAHRCSCGAVVSDRGVHGLSCRLAVGRLARHNAINDIIQCSGSVVATAYDFESGRPDSNPEWGIIYYKASITAQG